MHDGLELTELSKYTRPMLLQPPVCAAGRVLRVSCCGSRRRSMRGAMVESERANVQRLRHR